jgi:hypothetical protein
MLPLVTRIALERVRLPVHPPAPGQDTGQEHRDHDQVCAEDGEKRDDHRALFAALSAVPITGFYRSENRKKLFQPCCFHSRTMPGVGSQNGSRTGSPARVFLVKPYRPGCDSTVSNGTWTW